MMRSGTPLLSATRRALLMLETVMADGGASSVSVLARQVGLPVATAHRQVATLVADEFLVPLGGGRHAAGPRMQAMLGFVDDAYILARRATPALQKLSVRTGAVVQLGTLENDMVTYRLKVGQQAAAFFTRVDMQLEAYCSGIGKVLLAHLPVAECEAYLSNGPFVALTDRTITDPVALRSELQRVRKDDYACDDGEISPDLWCLAVPIHKPSGLVPAAISMSWVTSPGMMRPDIATILPMLRDTATAIAELAFSAH